ncbi:AAA family ATPase [Paraburkholderia ribeironis]|nr:AAA family ATPase [Paraburkholderia ribeironis]
MAPSSEEVHSISEESLCGVTDIPDDTERAADEGVHCAKEDTPTDSTILLDNLPPFLERVGIFLELQAAPPPRAQGFEKSSDFERMRRANDVRKVVTPFEQSIYAFNRLQLLLAASYDCRAAGQGTMLQQVFDLALQADAQLAETHDGLRSSVKPVRPLEGGGARCMVLSGSTGVGKSVLLDRFELYYNQKLFQPGRGRLTITGRDSWPHVPVLRVQCVANASLVGLATAVLIKLDALAGTKYSSGISRLTRDTFESRLEAALSACFVGMLVVEDIHHLKDNAANRKALLRFFANLMECSGVAVVLVGTCRAEEVVESVASLQAKMTSDGTTRFHRLENGIEFSMLCEGYWAQRVSHFHVESMPPDVKERIYFHTQGLPRIIWQLVYQMFLSMATTEGTDADVLNTELVDRVAEAVLPSKTRRGMDVIRRLRAGIPVEDKTLAEYEEYLFLDELDAFTENTERKYLLTTADYVRRFDADLKSKRLRDALNSAGARKDSERGAGRPRSHVGSAPASPAVKPVKRARGRPRKIPLPEPSNITDAGLFDPTSL